MSVSYEVQTRFAFSFINFSLRRSTKKHIFIVTHNVHKAIVHPQARMLIQYINKAASMAAMPVHMGLMNGHFPIPVGGHYGWCNGQSVGPCLKFIFCDSVFGKRFARWHPCRLIILPVQVHQGFVSLGSPELGRTPLPLNPIYNSIFTFTLANNGVKVYARCLR